MQRTPKVVFLNVFFFDRDPFFEKIVALFNSRRKAGGGENNAAKEVERRGETRKGREEGRPGEMEQGGRLERMRNGGPGGAAPGKICVFLAI